MFNNFTKVSLLTSSLVICNIPLIQSADPGHQTFTPQIAERLEERLTSKKIQSYLSDIRQIAKKQINHHILPFNLKDRLQEMGCYYNGLDPASIVQTCTAIIKRLDAEKLKFFNQKIKNKVLKELEPLYNQILLDHDMIRYCVDATFGRRDCQEQTLETLLLFEKSQHLNSQFLGLPERSQNLLALKYLLTDINQRDVFGMVVSYNDNPFFKEIGDKSLQGALKMRLAESTLQTTKTVGKSLGFAEDDLTLFLGKAGLPQIPAPIGLDVLLSYAKKKNINLVTKHIKILTDDGGLMLDSIDVLSFSKEKDKFAPQTACRESAFAIGIRIFSVQNKKDVTFPNITDDIEKFLMLRSVQFSLIENEPLLDRYKTYLDEAKKTLGDITGEYVYKRKALGGSVQFEYTLQPVFGKVVHMYPCTYKQQRDSALLVMSTMRGKRVEKTNLILQEDMHPHCF